jgi:hypothetical protein
MTDPHFPVALKIKDTRLAGPLTLIVFLLFVVSGHMLEMPISLVLTENPQGG